MEATENNKKNEKKYICEKCNLITCKKTDYHRHILTTKHIIATNSNHLATKNEIIYKPFMCENCNKEYCDRTGLWRHKKKCTSENTIMKEKPEICDKELIITLLKQNAELLEIVKNGTNINNTFNQTNCNNKTFNLQVFLNETCKDAMNLSEFIENISLQLSDLESMGKLGYVEGVSNIIIKSLNALEVTQRPVHCTDKKREIMYVKDDDEWQKEQDDKKRMKQVISSIVSKNLQLLPHYENKYPECMNPESKKSDEYNKIIMETMGGGINSNGEKNKEKIIRKIAKEVVIDKEL
jgi:hypothetical protein